MMMAMTIMMVMMMTAIGSYHDDVGQMCRAQSVDPAGAPHHWGAHVGDGHCQRACRMSKRKRGREGETDIREAVVCLVDSRGEKQRGGLLIALQPLTFLAAYFVSVKHRRVPNDSLLTRTLLHQPIFSRLLCASIV